MKEENVGEFIVRKENIEEQLQSIVNTLKIWGNFGKKLRKQKFFRKLRQHYCWSKQIIKSGKRSNERTSTKVKSEPTWKAEKSRSRRTGSNEKLNSNEKNYVQMKSLSGAIIEAGANLQIEKLESDVRLKVAETKKKDTNLKINKFRHEVEELMTQKHSTVSKGNSVRLLRTELKNLGGQVIKQREFWDTFEAIYMTICRYNQSENYLSYLRV